MSRFEKEIERLKSKPKDYTYDEAKSLLNKLGFFEYNKGKTLGSRVEFINEKKVQIELYKPHSSNNLKSYQIKNMIEKLKDGGLI